MEIRRERTQSSQDGVGRITLHHVVKEDFDERHLKNQKKSKEQVCDYEGKGALGRGNK